jgi:FkbM family methyltransferase
MLRKFVNKYLSGIAEKILPDSVYAFVYTRLWHRDTSIKKRKDGWLVKRGGVEMLIPTPKCLFMRLDEFEDYIERFFKIEPGDTVVDVGACFGDTTVPMAMKVGSKGKVIAIEPSPKNAQYLRINVQKFKNCEVIEKAISNMQGKTSFWLHNSPICGSIQRVPSRTKEVIVEVDTLDNVLADTHVDFLKIDTQGLEIEAIEGASETLHRVPKFIVDTHYRYDPEKRTYPRVLEMLKDFEHELHFDLDNGHVYAMRKQPDRVKPAA